MQVCGAGGGKGEKVVTEGTRRREEKKREKKKEAKFSPSSLNLTSRRKTPCRRRASSTTRSPFWGFCTAPGPGRSQRDPHRLGALSPSSSSSLLQCRRRCRRREQRQQQQQLASPSPLRGAGAPSRMSAGSDGDVLSREEERPRLLMFFVGAGKKEVRS